MLNRRLIRIKVFKVLYSSLAAGGDSVAESEKELLFSCEKTLHLYYFMMNIALALVYAAEAKIDAGLKKFHPTKEEAFPNRKFIENKFTAFLEKDDKFIRFCQTNGLQWRDDLQIFVRKLMAQISERDYFISYMNSPSRSLAEDCSLFIKIFEDEFEDNEEIYSILEDLSIYWMDDLCFVLNVIIRNITTLKDSSKIHTPNVFMKDDDREYAVDLLRYALIDYPKYSEVVSKNVANWDSDRLVATDIILISQGISEAVRFPNIPIKVTINEYVEISKFYSTPNSKVFVNGLLDKIIQEMVKTGEIVKQGRGLLES